MVPQSGQKGNLLQGYLLGSENWSDGSFFRTGPVDLSDSVSVTRYYFEWFDYGGGEDSVLSFRAFA
jgi:hypothetical protein